MGSVTLSEHSESKGGICASRKIVGEADTTMLRSNISCDEVAYRAHRAYHAEGISLQTALLFATVLPTDCLR